MAQELISEIKIKCLEIAQKIAPFDVEAKAKELFEWIKRVDD